MMLRMLRRIFPSAPARVAVEQLRMLLVNATFSFTLGGVANVLVAIVFALSAPLQPLAIWALACWLPVPVLHHLARGFARAPAPTEVVDRYTRWVVVACTVTGALRGVLPWIAFDHASPLAIAMLICFMAAIQAGSMAFMAPVLPAFAGYTLAFLVLLAAKLVTLRNPVYWAIAAGSALFGVAVIASARRLSVAFRTMVELRFENVELVERLRDESAMAQAARVEAENANQAKSKFLAAASHDLRQPIHAQGLFLEALSRSELSTQQRDVLTNARAACTASGDMLNTLLDFSRLEAGVVAVNARPFRLQPLLNRIENELAPLADRKDILYRSRETEAMIDSDAALVELILRNLVSNAIRYTERGGVLIGCRRRNGMLRIEVWDTGIGIAAEHHAEVFREFHQLGNPERDRRKGLGLGLAIAERLARHHPAPGEHLQRCHGAGTARRRQPGHSAATRAGRRRRRNRAQRHAAPDALVGRPMPGQRIDRTGIGSRRCEPATAGDMRLPAARPAHGGRGDRGATPTPSILACDSHHGRHRTRTLARSAGKRTAAAAQAGGAGGSLEQDDRGHQG
jgi:two-component system, sensor histidine kinase